jgi:hypothetical protein
MKQVRYELRGFAVGYNWYNAKGIMHLLIKTDKKGLKEIEKEPLQDFVGYGFQMVEFAFFEVYKIEEWEGKQYRTTRKSINPIKTIESGKYTLTEKEEEYLYEPVEPTIINYKGQA